MRNADANERLHTAALVEPHGELSRDRRDRRRTAAKIEADSRTAKHLEARTRWRIERDESRSAAYLAAGGESGPAQLWMPGSLRLPKHQDTSATLSGHYPFLAEAGLGSRTTMRMVPTSLARIRRLGIQGQCFEPGENFVAQVSHVAAHSPIRRPGASLSPALEHALGHSEQLRDLLRGHDLSVVICHDKEVRRGIPGWAAAIRSWPGQPWPLSPKRRLGIVFGTQSGTLGV